MSLRHRWRFIPRTRGRVPVFLGAITLISLASAAAQSGWDPELQRVLGRMEAVGKAFRTFAAELSQKKYTAVLGEFGTPEFGEFYYARAADGSALLRQDIRSPGRKITTIKGGTATIYQPDIKQAVVYNLGNNKDKVEYLALGIGQSPKKLQENFDIARLPDEDLDGTPCSVLVFKPRNPRAASLFASITLWVKKSGAIPIQQKLEEPGGDYLLVRFSREKLNSAIPSSKFEQKLPADTDIQRY
jgi:outer membrane lipoprotein-sorting protein